MDRIRIPKKKVNNNTLSRIPEHKTDTKTKSTEKFRVNNETFQKKMEDYRKMKKTSWTPEITFLFYAAETDKHEDLEYLHSVGKLESCINILLKKALLYGNEDLGKWFLQKGATLKNMSRKLPLLHFAASKGYSDFLKVLLEKPHVNVNALDENRETALHLALKNGNSKICRLLLQFGARTDIPDRDGFQLLHRAVQINNFAKVIDLLIEFNADIEAVDEHSKRPLEYGFKRSFNKQVVVCHLIKHGAKVGTTIVSHGPFYGKNAVQVGHTLGMTTSIMRAVRYRSSEINKTDLSVFDCVNLTGDIGALVDLLQEDGDILTLSDLDTEDTIKQLLSYVEMTGSHRLYQCMKEMGLLGQKTPLYVQRQDNIDKLAESDEDILKNDVRDMHISSREQEQSAKHFLALHFEVLDGDEFILTREKGESSNRPVIDTNSIEHIVVVSPAKDEGSLQKVVALAAQYIVHVAHGDHEKGPLTFTHIHTREFLTNSSLPYGIWPDQADDVFKLKLTGTKTQSYDCHSLHHHVLHNEVDELSEILHSDQTVDVNVKDEAGWTAFNLAILLGDREMVEMLLDRGATATPDIAQYLPAFVCGDWGKTNILTELSSFTLSVRLNLTDIVQLLIDRNPEHPSMDLCIKLSYGLKVESVLLESVCRAAEKKYQDIGARFKPTYTVRRSQPIQRVCLGFSNHVCDIEEKDDMHGVHVSIMNKEFSPDSVWTEDTEITEDQEVVSLTEHEKVVSKEIIDLWADHLWDCHPNLNAITAGSLEKCQKKPIGHIILHCSHKGYIPHESARFPTELTCDKGTMPVAVLEGEFRLGPMTNPSVSDSSTENNESGEEEPNPSPNVIRVNSTNNARRYPMETREHIPLKIGMHLSKSYASNENPNSGTLGIFVDMGNNKMGLVTCAHVFYKDEISKGEVPIYFTSLQQRRPTYAIAPQDYFHQIVIRRVEPMEVDDDQPVNESVTEDVYWECGKLVRAVFDSSLETGIDAALIEIDPIRVPRDGSFIDIKDSDLQKAAFNRRQAPTFTSGKQADMKYLNDIASTGRPIICMKVGAKSGLSVGILTYEHGQVRVYDSEPIGVERNDTHKYIFRNQIVIERKFFELGDSGSAVFVLKGGRGHYYPDACLGIAFAMGLKSPVTFVTPIGSILEKLKSDNNAPSLTLKSFK